MTKAEEIQRYDEFVRKLPQDSYLRPWLSGIRNAVEADLRGDMIPQHTPRETWQQCQDIRNDAAKDIRRDLERKRFEARTIIAEARAEAKRITDQAESECQEIRRTFIVDVKQLRRALDAVA